MVLLQVVRDVLQVELPLIQDQLQDLSQPLSELQRNTWSSEGDTSRALSPVQRGEVKGFIVGTIEELKEEGF